MRRVILLVCLLGCGGGGTGSTMIATGGSPGTGGAAGQIGSSGGTGATLDTGASGGDSGAGGSGGGAGGTSPDGSASGGSTGNVGTGGAVTGGSSGGPGDAGTGSAGGADTGSDELPWCPQVLNLYPNSAGCGFLGKSGSWISMWKDGVACAHCIAMGKQYTSCKIQSPEGVGGEGPGPDLCVMNCRQECCYRFPGATCETDAQCCSPLRCQPGDGGAKSCQ